MNHRAIVIGQRHGHRHRLCPQAFAHRRQRPPKISAGPIQLVDEKQRWQAEFAALAPDRFGLRLHPAHPVQHDHAAVQHPHGPLDLDGEIHMAGRINQLNLMIAPRQPGHGGGDGDAVYLLFGQIIHVGRAFMDFANLVGRAGVIQHSLGERGLAGVHMGGDADIAHSRQIRSLVHTVLVHQQ